MPNLDCRRIGWAKADALAEVVGPAGLAGLTRDQAAVINIYTQESPVYKVLNRMLLEEDADGLKACFMPMLKLLLSGLHQPVTVFRLHFARFPPLCVAF